AQMVHGLALVLQDQGKLADAEVEFRRALAGFTETLGDRHVDTAHVHCELGCMMRDEGRFAEAEKELLKAADVLGKDPAGKTAAYKNCSNALAKLYEAWDAAEPAQGHAERVAQWREK